MSAAVETNIVVAEHAHYRRRRVRRSSVLWVRSVHHHFALGHGVEKSTNEVWHRSNVAVSVWNSIGTRGSPLDVAPAACALICRRAVDLRVVTLLATTSNRIPTPHH